MELRQYEVEVLVNGKPVDEYLHDSKTFLEGKEGTEFSLRLRNRTGRRALFVPTIDGLSVMDGKEASFDSQGYIVNAYSSETIDGWRTSDDKVAKFFFAAVKESYAVKTGKGDNVGVIGCAVFEEKERVRVETIVIKEIIEKPIYVYPHWPYYNYPHNNVFFLSSNNHGGGGGGGMMTTSGNAGVGMTTATGGAQASSLVQASASIGTGFGEEKFSPVRNVSFDKESQPSAVFTLFYNTRENLRAMGVEFKKPLQVAVSAFPKESRYCVPPQN